MKALFVICLLSIAGIALAAPETYPTKYDDIDLDEILKNVRLRKAYIQCILSEGKCTPEGNELKLHIQDALETDCAKCSPTQRSGTNQVISVIVNEEPEYWEKMKAKFDPTGKYAKAHEAELRQLKKTG